jgi:hypothetical protein
MAVGEASVDVVHIVDPVNCRKIHVAKAVCDMTLNAFADKVMCFRQSEQAWYYIAMGKPEVKLIDQLLRSTLS